jgi:hypothetical protein
MKFLGAEVGDYVVLTGQEKKKGKFLAIWKKEDR